MHVVNTVQLLHTQADNMPFQNCVVKFKESKVLLPQGAEFIMVY